MWGVVSGTETRPLAGLQLGGDIWDKKDRLARVILGKSVKLELVIKIVLKRNIGRCYSDLKPNVPIGIVSDHCAVKTCANDIILTADW